MNAEPPVTAERSALMRRIKGKDSKPELAVRKTAHAMGYRYRLHAPDLPGHPDLVFSSRRKIILVHGCFWHRHPGCRRTTMPQTRAEFWAGKFARNIERDREVETKLTAKGWKVATIWECQTFDTVALAARIAGILGDHAERAVEEPEHGGLQAEAKP